MTFETPQTNDNIGSPAQRLMSRCTKTLLLASEDLLMPKIISPSTVKLELCNQKVKQKFYHDCGTKPLDPLHEGEKVLFREDGKWMPAVIEKETHLPQSYIIATPNGHMYRRNRMHLRPAPTRTMSCEDEDTLTDTEDNDDHPPTTDGQTQCPDVKPQLRRSSRIIQRPDRYDPSPTKYLRGEM